MLKKPEPHARATDLIFAKADAYDLVRRLGRPYPFLVPDDQAAEDLAAEYEKQFAGLPTIEVDRAVTKALAQATTSTAPTPGKIHEQLHRPEVRPSERHGYRPTYDYSTLPARIQNQDWARKLIKMGCDPQFIIWREQDRALTAEAIAKMKSWSDDKIAMHEASLAALNQSRAAKSRAA